MEHKTAFAFVIAAGLVAAVPLAAQAQDQRVHVSFGGGITAPNSEVRDRLGDGYNFNFGIDVALTPILSIEGLYSFNGLGDKRISIPVIPVINPTTGEAEGEAVPTDFFGDMNMQYGTASLVVQAAEGGVRPFGLIGMGVYYRPIKVTTPGVGYAPGYCDPWWYVCYPGGLVPVENIVGERSSTDFGMAFGGGVKFGPIFAELRYHYIWGPTIEGLTLPTPLPADVPANINASLAGQKANGQFLATTFGIRF
jgi:opacity protein-like surface antigen